MRAQPVCSIRESASTSRQRSIPAGRTGATRPGPRTLPLFKTPDAGADLRLGAPRSPGEKAAVGCTHFDGVAAGRRAVDFVDRTGVDPRMPAQQRFFPAGLEAYFHFFFARGCAAS